MQAVEEASEGKVEFDHYPTEQMGGAAELPDLLESGVADIASVAPAYVPSEFPKSSVSDLPGLFAESCQGSEAIMELVSSGGLLFEEEYESRGMVPLFATLSTKYEILTKDKSVESPEDLKGMQIRSGGGALDRTLTELGSSPIAMTGSEMYEAVQRGTVDGLSLNALTVVPYNLQEVVEYATVGAPIGNFTAIYAMNQTAYEGLSQEVQDAIVEASAATNQHVCEEIEKQNSEANDLISDAGVELYELDEDEETAWLEQVEPVIEKWADDTDGHDVVESFEAQLES